MRPWWTVYVVTDTGREVPHWSEPTRARAREFVRKLRNSGSTMKMRIRYDGEVAP